MTISKVSELTKLTKKAIRYYESVGLVQSKVLTNGYRDYSNDSIEKLNIIKILRQLSFSIEEIRECFKDQKTLLSNFSIKAKQLEQDKNIITNQIDIINNIVNKELNLSDIKLFQNDIEEINEKQTKKIATLLKQIFPGDFGQIITAAYSPFLHESISSIEQQEILNSLVNELDDINQITVPKELLLWAKNHNNEEEISNKFNKMKIDYSQDYEEFSENKKIVINEYLNNSEDGATYHTNLDLITFLSTECSSVIEIFGRYLPLLSKTYQQFYLKQERFLKENDELIKKLNK